ncbi:MAG TPA: restriction endonuclease subunit S [Saprospiraceae bacterium]|nr:restriction endonuclease subunit S [Saprospiraceae bacterium]
MMNEASVKAKSAWLGEFPTHWEVLRIKNLFQEMDSRSETGSEELLSVSHYTGVTLKRESLENEDDHLTNAESLVGYKLVQQGDLVINIMLAWNGSLGISPYNGITSPAYCVYRIKGDNNPKYFGYLFTTNLFKAEFRRHSTGIIDSRLRLYSDKFFSIFTVVPPKNEQDEIVQYIKAQEEKINLFIQKKQRFIELLKEQRQSKIDEAVDGTNKNWLSKKLKYIAEIKFSNVDKHTIEDEIPVRLCNYVDVYKNDYITNDLEFMNATATETEIEKFTVQKGDVIITKDSEEATDIAVPTFVKEDLENVVCGYHLALIRANENEILSEYLFRKFQSSELKAYFAIEATGVTRVGLSMGEITGVKISYPKSIEEQKQIVSHIKTETATIDTAIAKAEREIELIREYKEAMISEAVMGKKM